MFPIHVDVVKNRPWIARCLWVIVTIAILLLLFFYLRALQRKNRFKKSASIKPVYYDYHGNMRDEATSTDLRDPSFGAWFARWFLPGDERNELTFPSPNVDSITFVAADSNDTVNLPKEGHIPDTEKIRINGYKPDKDDQPKEPIRLVTGDKITVMKENGEVEGYLQFNSGDSNDGGGYRVFVGLLKLASLFGVIVLTYLMIKSFF